MAHVAASVPNLGYACDTHYPWQVEEDEVLRGGKVPIVNGCVAIGRAPRLGVELDPERLARLNEHFLAGGIRGRITDCAGSDRSKDALPMATTACTPDR